MYNEENNNMQQDNLNTNFTTYNANETFVESEVVPPVAPKKKHRFARVIVGCAAFGLVAGGTFAGVNYFANKGTTNNVQSGQDTVAEGKKEELQATTNDTTILSTNAVQGTTINDVSNVVSEVMPSIVSLTCTSTVQSNFFGQTYEQEQQGSGSGIIIGKNDNQLLIVTNNHVVSGAKTVEVSFVDDSKVSATIKGTDSSNDLAVVAANITDISEETLKNIKIATLGDSTEAKVGEQVIAIGNALGYGQSVTVGYLSAKDREVQTEDYTMNLLQTDAAINPGNSGGALLNAAGQVIGINSVKLSSTEVEGIGYAIPISYAVPIINDLMSREVIAEDEQAYLGIRMSEISSSDSQQYNIPEGIYVSNVTSGSPAQQYGIKTGDVIVGFENRDIKTPTELQELLFSKRGGTEVKMKVKRQSGNEYVEKELTIVLGYKKDSLSASQSQGQSNGNGSSNNGNSNGNNGNSNGNNGNGYYFGR